MQIDRSDLATAVSAQAEQVAAAQARVVRTFYAARRT